jgi:hypothetical protein
MWSSGEPILTRCVLGGRVVGAIPQRVVEDSGGVTVSWIQAGSQVAYPLGLADDGSLLHPDTWPIEVRGWHGNGCLELVPTGRRHMIRHFYADDGAFAGWYVNLQEPVVRRPRGLDSTDLQLDLWIEPGGRVTWKDEDHLEQAVGYGIFTREVARAVRAEAERVLDEWPFPTGWENWRPPEDWAPPALPEDWDVV